MNPSTLSLFLLLAAAPAFAALANGGFEMGDQNWATQNAWYEQPKGAGLSAVAVVEGEGRDGGRALRITGGGKRGIALQTVEAYPGRYRVSAWIRCQGLDAGKAGVLVEWMDREGKWMRGDWAAEVAGTQEWRRFEQVVSAPSGTRSAHFDLLTTEANNGTVWFADVAFERVGSDLPAPTAPGLHVETPAGREGCLEVRWDPKLLPEGTVRLLLFCEGDLKAPGALPRAVVDAEAGSALIWSLENGKNYSVAAVAANADGKASAMGAAVRATVADRQPPRPGWVEAQAAGAGRARIGWSPHVLDVDVRRIHFCAGAEGKPPREVKAVDAAAVYREARPFYCTAPWVSLDVPAPAAGERLGAWCEDAAGNRSEIAWAETRPAPADAAAPCALWSAPPTAQVRQDAPPPSEPAPDVELLLMRGEAKGFQVMARPERDLHAARVSFEALRHEDGRTQVDARWLAYHFVDYVNLEKNSRATPAEELLWKAPADYPDELSDDRERDLPAGKTQPIYVRVTAPRGTKPGLYRGRGYVECAEGRSPFAFAVRVAPADLPEPRLEFVYWFSWDDPCREFGVESRSEDGWRALRRLGELMRAHHQNVVVVPWNLIRTCRAPDGGLRHDFRDFDRFVRTFQDAGVSRLFTLSHVGSRATGEWTCPTMRSHRQRVARLDTGQNDSVDVLEVLPAIQSHLEERKWLDRFAVHVADEPITQNLASYRELSAKVKEAAPRLPRIDAVHVPDLKGALEIWVPQLNYFEQWLEQFQAAQKEGNELWFYIAWVPQGKFTNRMIDSAAIKSRALHWLNALYGTTGYLHWALNHWHISLMSLESPGDQYICWPSRRFIANSSLRYEAEREGLEDCELAFMVRDALQRRGLAPDAARARTEELLRRAVRSGQDYTRSWAEMEAARREMVGELGTR